MAGSPKKVVVRSDGKRFASTVDAAKHMTKERGITSHQNLISLAANGKRKSAYGFGWSYGDTPKQQSNVRLHHPSGDLYFPDTRAAVSWVMQNTPHTSVTPVEIARVCRGLYPSAYGFKWSFVK